MSDDTTRKSGITMPPTLVILAMILLLAAIAAQVVPPGSYQRTQKVIRKSGETTVEYTVKAGDTMESVAAAVGDDSTHVGEIIDKETEHSPTVLRAGMVLLVPVHKTESRTVVVPGSFAVTEREKFDSGVDLVVHVVGQVLMAPIRGFVNKAEIIGFILLIGGVFGMILSTGAVDLALRYAVGALSRNGADFLLIPVTMILFSAGGAIFGMSEEVIPFVMITIPLALRLGYDSITGLCMSFVAAGLGFAGAFFNPFTVQIAQGISELPPVSGLQLRLVVWVAVTALGVVYTMTWAARVKKNPAKSPTFENDRKLLAKFSAADGEHEVKLDTRHGLVLATLLGSVVLIIWGVVEKGWYINELCGVFMAAGVLSAAFGGIGLQKAAATFVRGAADLCGAALIVSFSAGILIVMQDGQILDTILNSIAGALAHAHPVTGACLMFTFQTALNFFVPSGSGQAAMTMPIMAPLADAMGISRQTAVLAFQFGDGFGNMIIPTSAVTMSVLGIAEIPWEKWAKWILPLEILLFIVGCVFLGIAVMTGYS